MTMRFLSLACLAGVLAFATTGCAEAELASHVIKQVPAVSQSKSVGHFKVGSSYKIKGKRYYPKEMYEFIETGEASWYGPGFHGKQTANGEIFNKYDMTAAHRTLQLPSIIRVTNLQNGRSAILRINDRGPFAHDRILDVSEHASTVLGFKNQGRTKIKLELLPEESRIVAEAAKQGRDTRGIEVAMNKRYANSKNLNEGPLKPPLVKKTSIAQNGNINTRPPVSATPLPSHATVTTTTQTTTTTVTPISTSGSHYVQVASLSSRSNAENLSRKLSDLGPTTVQSSYRNGVETYRVKIGPLVDRNQAQNLIPDVASRGFRDAIILTEK